MSGHRRSNESDSSHYRATYTAVTHICMYGNACTTKVQVKTRLASTIQAGVQPVSSLAALEVLIGEATVSVAMANSYNEVLLQQTCDQ